MNMKYCFSRSPLTVLAYKLDVHFVSISYSYRTKFDNQVDSGTQSSDLGTVLVPVWRDLARMETTLQVL